MTAEIRPGVSRPDWSVVTTAVAREALLGRDQSRAGLLHKWQHALEPAHDRVWRTVVSLFGSLGRPPHIDEIGEATGVPIDQVREIIAELEARDLLGNDPSGGDRCARYRRHVRHGRGNHSLVPGVRQTDRDRDHRP